MNDHIFRYHFSGWPSQFDGKEHISQLGTFDFEGAEVLAHVENTRVEDEKLLYISASRRASFKLLEKTIEEIKQMFSAGVIGWTHPSRALPIEERQRQNRLQSETKYDGSFLPDATQDIYLGFYLEKLIYKGRFIQALCPICRTWFLPEQCATEDWRTWGSGGDRLVCSEKHTLSARNTMMITEAPD